MKILGDIHTDVGRLARLMQKTDDQVLCVGDVGIGLGKMGQSPVLPDGFFFIRGNHDNPYWCKKHPQFVADYGMWRGIFVIGGAKSVDPDIAWRTENVNWWRDEQLSYMECQSALEAYEKAKPRIVVSHDAPASLHTDLKEKVVQDAEEKLEKLLAHRPVVEALNDLVQMAIFWEQVDRAKGVVDLLYAIGNPPPYTQTIMMDRMLEIHQPDLWLFGHWHAAWSKQIGRTRFRLLDIFEMIDLDEELAMSQPSPTSIVTD